MNPSFNKKDMASLSDFALTQLIKQGSETAFDVLTGRYLSLIRSKASMYKIQAADSEDFIQEGLLTLLHTAKTFEPDKNAAFSTYFSVCIAHRFSSIIRSNMREKDIPSNMLVSLDGCNENTAIGTPEQDIIDREDYKLMEQHIKTVLSKLEYKVLTCYLSGKSYGEIGNILDLSAKSVDNALQRIRKKLKKGKG